jgi:hypothetical protein
VRFVTLALKSVMRNDGDFVDVILIYMHVCMCVCVCRCVRPRAPSHLFCSVRENH